MLIHSKDILDFEDFAKWVESKVILIGGAGWSGLDYLDLLLTKCENKIIISGDTLSMNWSKDFKPYIESGRLILKEGWNILCKENSVIFQDGSEESVDVIIECIGFQWYW